MIHSSAAFFNPMISYSGHFSPSSFSGPETVDTKGKNSKSLDRMEDSEVHTGAGEAEAQE